MYCCRGSLTSVRALMVPGSVARVLFCSTASRKMAECSASSDRMPAIASVSPVCAASMAARTSLRRASCIMSDCMWLRMTSAILAESAIEPLRKPAISKPAPEPSVHRITITRPANFTLERIVESMGDLRLSPLV